MSTHPMHHQGPELTEAGPNGSPIPTRSLAGLPPLSNGTSADVLSERATDRPGKRAGRKKARIWWIAAGLVLVGVAVVATAIIAGGPKSNRPDLLLHTVKYEDIDLTIIERGALESSENKDVICNVKALRGGNFSTQISWVIEDGTEVAQGKHIATLESAALDTQLKDQTIAVSKAKSALIKSQGASESIIKENEKALIIAEDALRGAELEVEKYVGLSRGTLTRLSPEVRKAYMKEMEADFAAFLVKHKKDFAALDGQFQQLLDDVSGRMETAEAEYEQWKDKAAYSQRMVIKGYVTQSQAQADESRLNSAAENLKKLRTEKRLLQTFDAQKSVQNLIALLRQAQAAMEVTQIQTESKRKELAAELKAMEDTLRQEEEKFDDIQKQIKLCRVHAPQDGLVVYYTPEQSRFGGGSQQSIIAQGEPVREGQKLMRIPNLRKMQVVARVHEALISRIKGDVHKPTGFSEAVRAGALINRNFLPQLAILRDDVYDELKKDDFRERDSILAAKGQPARIRVDAYPDKPLNGHVRFKAPLASQDYFTSDVKVYQTVVAIDEYLEGLRPGMSAEVTIQVDSPRTGVLAVPEQAILGGPEQGDKRKIYVMTSDGPQEREIRVGLTNGKMAEIREGLSEGDQIVLNPKVLLGDKAKTRDAENKDGAAPGKGAGKGKGGGKGFKKE